MGVSNAGGVSKNRDYRKVSRFITCCQCCDHKVLSTRCHWTVASDKRQSLLMTGDDKEVLMTKSLNVMPKTTEQHLIAHSEKCKAEVTNNMPERIEYRLAVLVYRCQHGLAPSYLAEELHRVADIDS